MKTQTRWLFPFVMMFMVCVLVPDRALADVKSLADPNVFPMRTANTIYVEVQTSTWKTRGRFLWDAPADIRAKLIAVGFEIVRDKNQPHALSLTGSYEETRGRQFGINRYGTVLSGTFRIEHHAERPVV